MPSVDSVLCGHQQGHQTLTILSSYRVRHSMVHSALAQQFLHIIHGLSSGQSYHPSAAGNYGIENINQYPHQTADTRLEGFSGLHMSVMVVTHHAVCYPANLTS